MLSACAAPDPRVLPEGTSLLLVTLDTTRQDFLSPYGADPAISPNLAKLASRGALFLEAYSQANVTNPSHVSIATGLPAIEHGIFDNFATLRDDLDTLPRAFQRRGFETAGFPAATHVGEQLEWKGFDHFEPAEGELNAEQVSDRFLAWLKGRSERRAFFAWVHYFDPHSDYDAPAEIQKRFYEGDPNEGPGPPLAEHRYFDVAPNGAHLRAWIGERRDPEYPRAMYAAEIHYMDRELGRVLRHLEDSGLADRTVVVVIADHGESITEHGIFFSHRGLYETQLRIPWIVDVPGFPDGARIPAKVSQLDLAPTVSELFDVPLNHATRGRSLVPFLRGEAGEEREVRDIFIHEAAHNYQAAFRRGRWKLILPVKRDYPVLPADPMLFDLESDPGELENLAARNPEIVEEMASRLHAWESLGEIPFGELTHLDEEQLRRLRALGYVR